MCHVSFKKIFVFMCVWVCVYVICVCVCENVSRHMSQITCGGQGVNLKFICTSHVAWDRVHFFVLLHRPVYMPHEHWQILLALAPIYFYYIFSLFTFQMLSPFWFPLWKHPIPSPFPLLTNPLTPTSLSWYSLILGQHFSSSQKSCMLLKFTMVV